MTELNACRMNTYLLMHRLHATVSVKLAQINLWVIEVKLGSQCFELMIRITRMCRLLKQMLLVHVFLFALAGQAIADSLSDARSAYSAGNYAMAAKLIRPLAEQGDAFAQFSLGGMYALGRGVPQDDKEAVKWLQLAAEQGDARAQFNLGIMYANGQGVPRDYGVAAKWYRLAAEQNYGSSRNSVEKKRYVARLTPLPVLAYRHLKTAGILA